MVGLRQMQGARHFTERRQKHKLNCLDLYTLVISLTNNHKFAATWIRSYNNYHEKKAKEYLGKDKTLIARLKKHLSYRNYSKYTIVNYVKEVNHLCCYHQASPLLITERQLENYLYYLVKKKKSGPSKINVAIASFTYFYCNIVGTPEKVKKLRSPRIPKSVPFVLAPQEVYQFVESLSELRDKVIIQLLYSTGIRVGECMNLKRQHINKTRMTIKIEKGKGQKGRYVPLSPMMLKQLESYYKKYRPKDYIFYTRSKSIPMCRVTVNRIIRNANKALKTKEKITPHTFRHSFATMLTEEGESLFTIQRILGHKSFHSTFRYIRAAKTEIKSCINPLDKIYEDNNIMLNRNVERA